MKLIIRNAVLIDKDQSVKNDLLIEDGKIVKIGELKGTACDQVIDADGKSIMPAFIDMHAHFRTPGYEYKEDFRTGFHAHVTITACTAANASIILIFGRGQIATVAFFEICGFQSRSRYFIFRFRRIGSAGQISVHR